MIAQSMWWNMFSLSELKHADWMYLSILWPLYFLYNSLMKCFHRICIWWRPFKVEIGIQWGLLVTGHAGSESIWHAVKGNRFNHAVKQVFTGLHYNVIFSPPLSLSILLPSESLDFFRLMIFDQRERVGWGGYGLMIQYILHVWELCIRRKKSQPLKRCGGL